MKKKEKLIIIPEILEKSGVFFKGIEIWKNKNVILTEENWEENIFILSTDLASYLKIRHTDIVRRNIYNLLKNGYLQNHLRMGAQMVEIGSKTKRNQQVYQLQINEIGILLLGIQNEKILEQKLDLFKFLQNLKNQVLQYIDNQEVIKIDEVESSDLPLVPSILEMHCITPEGIQIWKSKGVTLTFKNELENIFILSDHLADYFKIRHYDFVLEIYINYKKKDIYLNRYAKLRICSMLVIVHPCIKKYTCSPDTK